MFFVEARYHRSPDRAAGQVRYIAHREEGLTDGRRRELFGIGERYRALRGDEPAIRRTLRDDGRGLRNPAYFRFIMTVDNPIAERFQRLDGLQTERVMRDAIDKTFRGSLRGAQGVFAVHHHGGTGRPAHPHVHALLSPRFANGMAVHISPQRIQRIKGAVGEGGPGRAAAAGAATGQDAPAARAAPAAMAWQSRGSGAARNAAGSSGAASGHPARAIHAGEGSLAVGAKDCRGQAVAAVRLARYALGTESGEGCPPSHVPACLQGDASWPARSALGAPRSANDWNSSAIGSAGADSVA